MSFQIKKPSIVLKHLSSIAEKQEAEDSTSPEKLSSQKEQKNEGHK